MLSTWQKNRQGSEISILLPYAYPINIVLAVGGCDQLFGGVRREVGGGRCREKFRRGETHRVEGGEGFVLAIDQSPVARARSRRGVSDASCLLKVPPKKRSRSTSGEGSASSKEKRKEKTQNRLDNLNLNRA